jgi:hypothetical protein
MAGSMIDPMAATSATPDPEMAPKSMHDMTMTMAMPPGMCPTRVAANLVMRGVMPPSAMTAPARRKSGMARSVKESTPTTMRWASTRTGTLDWKSR